MELFNLLELEARPYYEFMRVRALSLGLYKLPNGGVDRQKPHTEDEAYCVISGRAMVQVGDEERPVWPGTVVFVPAGVEHRFHSITEDLRLFVAFGPAEGTAK